MGFLRPPGALDRGHTCRGPTAIVSWPVNTFNLCSSMSPKKSLGIISANHSLKQSGPWTDDKYLQRTTPLCWTGIDCELGAEWHWKDKCQQQDLQTWPPKENGSQSLHSNRYLAHMKTKPICPSRPHQTALRAPFSKPQWHNFSTSHCDAHTYKLWASLFAGRKSVTTDTSKGEGGSQSHKFIF